MNQKKAFHALAVILLACLFSASAFAITEEIPVQGKLTDASGNALTGNYSFVFELYDSNVGGSLLWSETRSVPVANGVFNTTLGDVNASTYLNTVDFNSNTWLSILVGGTRQEPMVKLGSVPSAYSAKHTFGGDSNFSNIGANNNIYGSGLIVGDKFKSEDANSVFGTNAVALGSGTTAFGNYGTAMGEETTASGDWSTAMGLYTTASGDYGLAVGYQTIASGIGSTAFGGTTVASGLGSTAMGENTIASGQDSVALGVYSRAVGIGSFASGKGNIGSRFIFAIGDGAIALGYSDTNMVAGDEASDKGAIALGYNVQALGEASVALGKNIINSSPNSVALYDLNVAHDANFLAAGTPFFDGNFFVKSETGASSGTTYNCGIDGTGSFKCYA